MQVKGPMVVKKPTEVNRPTKVNFKHGGAARCPTFKNDGVIVEYSTIVLLEVQLAIICF